MLTSFSVHAFSLVSIRVATFGSKEKVCRGGKSRSCSFLFPSHASSPHALMNGISKTIVHHEARSSIYLGNEIRDSAVRVRQETINGACFHELVPNYIQFGVPVLVSAALFFLPPLIK